METIEESVFANRVNIGNENRYDSASNLRLFGH
jgi:hypothetical protein